MKKTSIIMDNETRKVLDEYCIETGTQLSGALRIFIKKGLEQHAKEKASGYRDSIGANGLMLNQKYAIRAAIESTLILRKLAKSFFKNEDSNDEINAAVSKIMKSGWQYDNNE